MITSDDEHWMRGAIAIATEKGASPSLSPIGAVIVHAGRMIAGARNQVDETKDATAHAEMMAFHMAAHAMGETEWRDAVLYTTLKPCGMCTMASIWAKVGRIVYGAGREDVHSMYFEDRHLDAVQFISDAWRDDLTIEGGCLRDACAALYYRPWDNVPEAQQGNV